MPARTRARWSATRRTPERPAAPLPTSTRPARSAPRIPARVPTDQPTDGCTAALPAHPLLSRACLQRGQRVRGSAPPERPAWAASHARRGAHRRPGLSVAASVAWGTLCITPRTPTPPRCPKAPRVLRTLRAFPLGFRGDWRASCRTGHPAASVTGGGAGRCPGGR